jgi:DNA-binding ferritin-like protein
MLIEAALIFQTNMNLKTISEAKKSIPDSQQRFVEAEQKEDKYTRDLFERLLETMERESWKSWDYNRSN